VSKWPTVARTEYLRAVRTKGFIVGVLMMPVLMSGGLIAGRLSKASADVHDRHFAVLDRSGEVLDRLQPAAEVHNRDEIWDPDERTKQIEARFLPEAAAPDADVVALSDRVRRGELAGFLVIGADVLRPPGEGDDRELLWHTDTPTYDDLPRWIRTQVNELAQRQRLSGAGIDSVLVERLSERVPLRTMGLAQLTAEGEVRQGEETNEAATVWVPLGLSLLLFMLVMSTAPALLNSVLEEKMQKIAEVLVATVDPFDLLLGKLLATTGVALTLSVIYLGASMLFLRWSEVAPPAVLAALSPTALAWYAIFQILALLTFGSIYAAIGSACSEIQDAQNLMGPIVILTAIPVFFLGPVLKSPDGPVSRVLSLIPTATPVLMMIRVSSPPGPAWWELALALVFSTAFADLCVWMAGRIFRMGILSQGQAPSWRRLWQWARAR
jgi:ABC-2 type transport system permease protein